MTNQEKKHLWEQRLQEYQQSTKSAIQWCKEQHISYAGFCYWKSKLRAPVQKEEAFEELEDPSTGVELQWGQTCLRLGKDFDIATLEKCLIALRRAQC